MFSQPCFIPSVHGGGGHVWQRGACMVKGACMANGGYAWQRGVCVAKGTCVAGGHAWQGGMHGKGCAWQGGMRGRRHGHCSGRYASYWNAFLYKCDIICHILPKFIESLIYHDVNQEFQPSCTH